MPVKSRPILVVAPLGAKFILRSAVFRITWLLRWGMTQTPLLNNICRRGRLAFKLGGMCRSVTLFPPGNIGMGSSLQS